MDNIPGRHTIATLTRQGMGYKNGDEFTSLSTEYDEQGFMPAYRILCPQPHICY